MGQKWEYETEWKDNHLSIEELNAWGQEGWELAGVTVVRGLTMHFRYIFKRPLTLEGTTENGKNNPSNRT